MLKLVDYTAYVYNTHIRYRRERVVPVPHINIETPYYKGEIETRILDSVLCDLVIRNIGGGD